MEFRYAGEADAAAMAGLFAANHRDALSERDRTEQGFVQGALDLDSLRGLARAGNILVADASGELAGFLVLSPATDVPSTPPPVLALLEAQGLLLWQGRPLNAVPWILYGPILVDRGFRGHGVARGLYNLAKREAAARAELLVAFIESSNPTSLRVHVEGLGMTPLGDFTADGRTYHAVAAPVGEP